MSDIETYYLIDFENVNHAGLSCSGKLTGHDHIHIFSTKNTPNANFKDLSAFNDADLNLYSIPAGNQSLDMHLIAYLGYLIGLNGTKKCKYIIVSKDKDYDNVISFFHEKTNAQIVRQSALETKPKKTLSDPKKKTVPSSTNPNSQLNIEIQRAISNAGYDKATSNKVASIVCGYSKSEHFSSDVHNALKNSYTKYIDLYNIVKPIIKKHSADAVTTASPATQINNEIQKALSKASFDNKTVSYAASLVCKYYKSAKGKQTIHNALISEYGKDKGGKIYGCIKTCI